MRRNGKIILNRKAILLLSLLLSLAAVLTWAVAAPAPAGEASSDEVELIEAAANPGPVYEVNAIPAGGVGGTLGRGSGGNCYWFLNSSGKLIIRPTSGGGWTGNNDGYAELGLDNGSNYTSAAGWPWNQYRGDIKEVEVLGNVVVRNGVNLTSMFENCTQLTTVNIANLNTNGARSTASMFRDCSALSSIVGIDTISTANVQDMSSMFRGCTALEKLDLSSWTNNGKVYNMQYMFRDSGIKSLTLNHESFKTRPYSNGGVMLQGMFSGCSALKEVDLSNITLTGRPLDTNAKTGHEQDQEATGMFRGLASLTTVTMSNTRFENMASFKFMFADCPALTRVEMVDGMGGSMYINDAVTMYNMFANSFTSPAGEGMPTLDVSGFGKLDNIVQMDGFVQGCTGLQVLNLSNLDNSRIKPRMGHHPAADEDLGAAMLNVIWGRELGVESCTGLKTLSAQNSKVWMCRNEKGTPGAEYYLASSNGDVLYFTNKQMEFAADAGPTVTIASKRDYVDLITDRDGGINTHSYNPEVSVLPDAGVNINIVNGDLNTNGPSFLAPGVYTIENTAWTEEHAPMAESYYRISYIGEVPYKVLIAGTEVDLSGGIHTTADGLVIVKQNDNTWVSTEVRDDWPISGSVVYDLTEPITIVYENAAIDVNGKLHDVAIEINKVTFKNLERIPVNEYRNHDNNKYVDNPPYLNPYYRTILQATKTEGVLFRNYVRAGDPTTEWSNYNFLSGGSGTDIDFTVSIVGANEGTSFIFYVDDLDVAESQDWIRDPDDACYDELPIENTKYGKGGEGVIIGAGNDLGTISFAPHTGLMIVDDNYVITTGSDPSTSWSEFTVKADAKSGGSYTWTSGIGCTTYALRNTPKLYLGQFQVDFEAKKVLSGGTLKGGDYQFKLEEVEVDPSNAPKKGTLNTNISNTADGTVNFGTLTFGPVAGNSLVYDAANYYPGTSQTSNTHGGGTHNTFTYTYKVSEIIPTSPDPSIVYDSNPERTIKLVITTPENDAEMEKGLKVEVYVNNELKETSWKRANQLTSIQTDPVSISLTSYLTFTNKALTGSIAITKTTENGKAGDFKFKVKIWKSVPETLDHKSSKLKQIINGWYNRYGYTDSGIINLFASYTFDPAQYRKTLRANNQGKDIDTSGYTVTSLAKFVTDTLDPLGLDPFHTSTPLETHLSSFLFDNKPVYTYFTIYNNPGHGYGLLYYFYSYKDAYEYMDLSAFGSAVAGEEGTYEFTLKNGETKLIDQIPVGCQYEIWEETPDGWVLISVDGDSSKTKATGTITSSDLDREHTFTNRANMVNLTISKTVTGNMGNKAKYFKFEIRLEGLTPYLVLTLDMSNADLAPKQNSSTVYTTAVMEHANARDDDDSEDGQQIISDAGGTAVIKVYLQHGQSVTIRGIPYGAEYYVVETPEGYTPELDLRGDDKTGDAASGSGEDIWYGTGVSAVKDTFLRLDTTLNFTNDLDTPVPTGIYDSVAPAFVGLSAGTLLLGTVGIFRKKRKYAA